MKKFAALLLLGLSAFANAQDDDEPKVTAVAIDFVPEKDQVVFERGDRPGGVGVGLVDEGLFFLSTIESTHELPVTRRVRLIFQNSALEKKVRLVLGDNTVPFVLKDLEPTPAPTGAPVEPTPAPTEAPVEPTPAPTEAPVEVVRRSLQDDDDEDVVSPPIIFSLGERGDFPVLLQVFDDTDGPVLESFVEGSIYIITGFESIVALLMLVVISLLSRNVYISMFFGIWIGALVIAGGDIPRSFRELFDVHMIPQVTDEFNFRTITFTLFIAGFISLVKKSGGQEGFSNLVGRLATSPRLTQLAAVIAGVLLFFDDYSSVLILGSSFKKLTDRFFISREKLAFVADSTSAPIASISPISSWIAFELGRISDELENVNSSSRFESRLDLPGEYQFFLNTIPSRYYPIFMLVIQLTLILAGVEFGPMLFAERKTRLGKRTDGGDGRIDIPLELDLTNPAPDTPKRAYNFFIPIGFFLATLLASLVNIGTANLEDGQEASVRNIFGATDSFAALVYTTMGATLFSLVFYLIQTRDGDKMALPTPSCAISAIDCRLKSAEDMAKQEGIESGDLESKGPRPLMYFTEGVNTWVEGFKNLVPAILILCMAFTIKSIVTGAAADRFITAVILDSGVDPAVLPTLIFIIASLLSLVTGTSFGTMSIMFPLVSLAVFESSGGDIELFTIALSSIMAGAIFGDHSSLISDTTILASIGAGCSIGSHVYTQFPYALWGALFSVLLGTLPAGYGAPAGVMLGVGAILLIVTTIAIGAPIVARSGRLDLFSELFLLVTCSKSLKDNKEATRKFAAENPHMVDADPLGRFFRGYEYAPAAIGNDEVLAKQDEVVDEDKAVQDVEAKAAPVVVAPEVDDTNQDSV